MVSQLMTVGPKGQVVIPKILRDSLKVLPGMKVLIEEKEKSIVLSRPKIDSVQVFERIAKSGKTKEYSKSNYEKQLLSRWDRTK